jgi:CheY-like chemotaxis protein
VTSDVCRGLDFAHSKDVIHRDLKPGNVWLTDEGVAKIGDFGIAFTPAHTRVTQTGIIMGTVSYMPPEQGMGRTVDARSDLYSLGAMLYELVTGHRPFEADHPVAVISMHINAEPAPPTTHNPLTSTPLEGLIMRLLSKDPDERYQSATAVLETLEAISGRDETAAYAPVFGEMEIKPIRLLIMQDSEQDTQAILAELRKGGYEPTHGTADSALTMAAALESQKWDLIITEYSMPNFSAPAGLKVVEMNGLDVPFIIVSDAITEEIAVAVLKGGAHDYVMKNNLARLVPAVQRELREAEVREERRRVEGEQAMLHQNLGTAVPGAHGAEPHVRGAPAAEGRDWRRLPYALRKPAADCPGGRTPGRSDVRRAARRSAGDARLGRCLRRGRSPVAEASLPHLQAPQSRAAAAQASSSASSSRIFCSVSSYPPDPKCEYRMVPSWSTR